MAIIPIDDPDDGRVADYRALADHRALRARGLFIAEGRFVVRRLLESDRFAARSLLVTAPALEDVRDLLTARAPALPVYLGDRALLAAVAGFDLHRGCVAIGERHAPAAIGPILRGSPVVMLEGVGNPDNVGGVFRNARAFGASGVLLAPGCADPLYRKAIRTSMAATLQVPFAHLEEWPAALEQVRQQGLLVAALAADGAIPLEVFVATVRERRKGVAWLLGNEGEGLSAAACASCDARVRIPMQAGVDSLNVAAASAVALYETVRVCAPERAEGDARIDIR